MDSQNASLALDNKAISGMLYTEGDSSDEQLPSFHKIPVTSPVSISHNLSFAQNVPFKFVKTSSSDKLYKSQASFQAPIVGGDNSSSSFGAVGTSDMNTKNKPPLKLLTIGVLILLVGGFLFFLQQHHNSQQTANLNELSTKTTKLQTETKEALQDYQAVSTQQNVTIPQNLTVKTLNVTGQTTLSQVKATAIQATTINGSQFPTSTATSKTTTSTSSSGGTKTIVEEIQSGSSSSSALSIGSYVASLGSLTGLNSSGNSGAGSTPSLAVIYGASPNTAVQGSTQVSITAGTGLTGGGTITLGNGGSATLNVAYGGDSNTAAEGNTILSLSFSSGNLTGGISGTAGGGFATNTLAVSSTPNFSDITANGSGTALALTGAPTNSETASLLQLGSAIANGNTNVNGYGGTYLGINEPATSGAGSAADFLNFENGGVSELEVDSGGDITSSGSIQAGASKGLYVGTTEVCTSAGCIGGGGDGPAAINNGYAANSPQGANFYIQSNNTSWPTATIEAEDNQTSNLFEVLSYSPSSPLVIDSIDASGNLTVQSATVDGSLSVNGHIITGNNGGGTTQCVLNTSTSVVGTGATVTSSRCDDSSGTISIHTGTGSSLDAGDLIDITFANQYVNSSDTAVTPSIVITPNINNSTQLEYFVDNASSTGFAIATDNGPSASTTYSFNYIVEQ